MTYEYIEVTEADYAAARRWATHEWIASTGEWASNCLVAQAAKRHFQAEWVEASHNTITLPEGRYHSVNKVMERLVNAYDDNEDIQLPQTIAVEPWYTLTNKEGY